MAPTGDKRVMTVFFSDIEGFSAICEQLSPDGVVKLLNHYFTVMSEPIKSKHGIIDKYIGDAIMAFWGPPFSAESEHAVLACHAALDQLASLEKFRAALPDIIGLRKGLPSFRLRAGISTGDVIVGTIGSEGTKSYTVIGDTVNLASRLEAVNKHFGTSLIISECTWTMAKSAIEVRELDYIYVVGKSEPSRVFELLGRSGQVDSARLQLRDEFGCGLQCYRDRDWSGAKNHFDACLKLDPNDGPSKLFVARLKHFRDQPPSESWDGVWTLHEK
jgi:adenylate cyclase